MNERIKQLAEQARKYARDYVAECKHYGHYMEQNEYELRVEQKFAELIVRECVQVSEDDITDGDACCTNTADRIARQIKKHFGVEE